MPTDPESFNAVGKYAPGTTWYMDQLASVLIDQGRYAEAEVCFAPRSRSPHQWRSEDSFGVATSLTNRKVISFQRRYKESEAVLPSWTAPSRNGSRKGGKASNSIRAASISTCRAARLKRASRLPERSSPVPSRALHNHLQHPHFTPVCWPWGFARAGRQTDAIREFKAAVSQFAAATREDGQEDNEFAAASAARYAVHSKEYIALVARMQPGESELAETFQVADVVRGSRCKRALVASSCPFGEPRCELAGPVRKSRTWRCRSEPDRSLDNVLSLPVESVMESGPRAHRQVAKLRTDRAAARKDLLRNFPSYPSTRPEAPSVSEIRAVLRPQEALLSSISAVSGALCGPVPKDGPIGFASVAATQPTSSAWCDDLREALEPKARPSKTFRIRCSNWLMSSLPSC